MEGAAAAYVLPLICFVCVALYGALYERLARD